MRCVIVVAVRDGTSGDTPMQPAQLNQPELSCASDAPE